MAWSRSPRRKGPSRSWGLRLSSAASTQHSSRASILPGCWRHVRRLDRRQRSSRSSIRAFQWRTCSTGSANTSSPSASRGRPRFGMHPPAADRTGSSSRRCFLVACGLLLRAVGSRSPMKARTVRAGSIPVTSRLGAASIEWSRFHSRAVVDQEILLAAGRVAPARILRVRPTDCDHRFAPWAVTGELIELR